MWLNEYESLKFKIPKQNKSYKLLTLTLTPTSEHSKQNIYLKNPKRQNSENGNTLWICEAVKRETQWQCECDSDEWSQNILHIYSLMRVCGTALCI